MSEGVQEELLLTKKDALFGNFVITRSELLKNAASGALDGLYISLSGLGGWTMGTGAGRYDLVLVLLGGVALAAGLSGATRPETGHEDILKG